MQLQGGVVVDLDSGTTYEGYATLSYTLQFTSLERLIKVVQNVLARHRVPFWLAWGTCLGAVRDGKLIPWDSGGDYGSLACLTREERLAITDALRSEGFLAFWEIPAKPLDDCWCSLTAAGVKKATVELALQGAHRWNGQFTILTEAVSLSLYKTESSQIQMENLGGVTTFPLELFRNLQPVRFLESEFFVPNPPEAYLRLCYGADWRTPKREGWQDDWKVNP